MAYRIELNLADFASVSKFSEYIDHYVGRHVNHRGSCGEDIIPKHNGSIEISLLLQMVFVHSSDGGVDQGVGGLEALVGVNDLASC